MNLVKRNFKGDDVDRKYYGPAPNKLMPDIINLQTHINTSTSICIILYYLIYMHIIIYTHAYKYLL